MNNIIGTYINNTQEKLKKYSNLILKSKYDRRISDELIQTYIDARYYNYDVNYKIRIFYRRIYDALRRKSDILIKEEPRKKELIDNTLALFQYYFYFDNVRDNVEIEEIVKSIEEKRIFKLKLKSALKDNFREEFTEIVKRDIKEANNYLELYETNDFGLNIKRVNSKDNEFYRVKLKYNFEFPEIFSKEAIEEVFNTDIVNEDKLFVEYPMIANLALKDILNANFNKVYICDFTTELFNKKQKLEQLLGIIDNQAAQDKISLEVSYEDFINNKEEIFKCIKRGFRFVLKTNNEMPKLSNEELKILEIFNCIIISTNDVNKRKYKNIKILEE